MGDNGIISICVSVIMFIVLTIYVPIYRDCVCVFIWERETYVSDPHRLYLPTFGCSELAALADK